MTTGIETPTYERRERAVGREALLPALAEWEEGGAFGITLAWRAEEVGMRAWRKRDEPCYETGRTAAYEGPCLAVGDDDHHFIAGTIRMCEKTARVYRSEAYRGLLTVSAADPALYARLGSDPVPFDCDTLAGDAEAIANRIEPRPEPPERTVVYLGPFRYVVLENGTILRRGLPAAVSAAHAELLEGAGYVAAVALAAPPAASFLDLYRAYGPLFLVGRGAGRSPIRVPDFSALESLSTATRERLGKMITRGDSYFMLQGTDPAVGGCCPLPHVGESNQLVAAGLLDSWASPMSPDCPVTAYALAGEVGEVGEGLPRFRKNELLRRTVAAILAEGES